MYDEIDRGLVHALHVDGRVPFTRVADVLGVSTQTVLRRYRRLRERAGLRVVGLADQDRSGAARWLTRITAGPQVAHELARALARRADTSWVKLASGGTEIVAIVHDPTGREALLRHDIPRTAGITAMSAHQLLHTYLGGPTTWRGRLGALSREVERELAPRLPDDATAEVTDADGPLLAALALDGRTALADLARRTGVSAATAGRRLQALRASGALYLDVELDDAAFGAGVQAMLWMSVRPGELDAAATALAAQQEPAFVAATTGPTNLVALVVCADPPALHRYLTGPLAGLGGIRSVESAPMMATVKAAGPLAGPAGRAGLK